MGGTAKSGQICLTLLIIIDKDTREMDIIENAVFRVIEKVVGAPVELTVNSLLSDLRINSIKIIQIIAMLENDLDFELDEEDLLMSNFSTPGRTINLLREKYSKASVE